MILNYLSGRKDHPTAEMIYLTLKEEDSKLSLGTVYRNLSLLSGMGLVRKITTGDGPDHFDADVTDHFHFVCTKCQNISDLRGRDVGEAAGERARSMGMDVQQVSVTVYGICDKCSCA